MSSETRGVIQKKYGSVAASDLSNDHTGVREVAEAFGYTASELGSIPADANMGLSCGNPTAFANLRAGETVVDLGCGGGLDVFLASEKVGPNGKAIGIDMTPEMIRRATRNAEKGIGGKPYTNVRFLLGQIDNLPLPDGSVDCVVSNCVINLAADKSAVFSEMFRVLKPGGRVSVSDIAIKKTLPAEIAKDVMALVGCIAGAIPIDEYRNGLTNAGFSGVQIIDSGSDLNAYSKVEGQSVCCAPPMESSTLPMARQACCGTDAKDVGVHAGLAGILQRHDVNEYAASVKVYAIKPKRG